MKNTVIKTRWFKHLSIILLAITALTFEIIRTTPERLNNPIENYFLVSSIIVGVFALFYYLLKGINVSIWKAVLTVIGCFYLLPNILTPALMYLELQNATLHNVSIVSYLISYLVFQMITISSAKKFDIKTIQGKYLLAIHILAIPMSIQFVIRGGLL